MKKAYLLVFNREIGRDYTKLHEGIKNDPEVLNWWHYLNSAYILISFSDTHSLSEKIRLNYMSSNNHFILFDITSMSNQGWIPQEAWDWINNNI